MGQDGSILRADTGDRCHFHPEEIPFEDLTGARDASWTGEYPGFPDDFSAMNLQSQVG